MHNRFDYMGPNMSLSWFIPLVVLLVIALSIYMINKNNNAKVNFIMKLATAN